MKAIVSEDIIEKSWQSILPCLLAIVDNSPDRWDVHCLTVRILGEGIRNAFYYPDPSPVKYELSIESSLNQPSLSNSISYVDVPYLLGNDVYHHLFSVDAISSGIPMNFTRYAASIMASTIKVLCDLQLSKQRPA